MDSTAPTPKRAKTAEEQDQQMPSPATLKRSHDRQLHDGLSDGSLDTLLSLGTCSRTPSQSETPFSASSSGVPRSRLLELTDTTFENSPAISTVLSILKDEQYTLSRLIASAGAKTTLILWHVLLFAKKWEMRYLKFRLQEWICEVAIESYKASMTFFELAAMLAEPMEDAYSLWGVKHEHALDAMKWTKKAWVEWTPEWLYALQHASARWPGAGDKQNRAAGFIRLLQQQSS
ncbi:hypothetical protein L198_02605 [Cryptococcus wingfieldii CBS 7118]|uniref:Uncharacterized protein n=1 Tax=Cryptococcus wingfieldii CBS 7118 TaxID=1295528 RepID=A0A1E3JP18_9TREE|nr:hypothetical protein L198_02605 [Cryptococcus wingfieldii CBS 7118]ODO01877.1 hypothetical protein L198_02605 [Cryptococcus wingfieldii CBS 7118]